MIVALGLSLNVAAIILGCILSMLLSVFNALGPISIPTPLTVALTEFFHADTVASVHLLPVLWYFISSVCVYLCSCMHIMSILCSTADTVSSGSWPILFKVLTLNVTICIVCLHFSSFCYSSSVADFSNTEARAPTTGGRALFFTRAKSDAVYVCGLSVGHGCLSMAVFILIYRSLSYRRAAVVLTILSVEPHVSYAQDQVRHCVWPSHGLFAYLHVHHAASHVYVKKQNKKTRGAPFPVSFNLVKVQD